MDIRVRIDQLRIERGWTRADLAREAGISYTAVKNWYNEKDHMPSLRVIDDICAAFKITKAQLFADVDTDNLREDQVALLELFEKLSEEQKKSVLGIVKDIIKNIIK